jgi:hypothetical protein
MSRMTSSLRRTAHGGNGRRRSTATGPERESNRTATVESSPREASEL